MQSLIIEKTKNTPGVLLDKRNGIFELSGKSIPINRVEFYFTTLNWFREYFNYPNPITVIDFKLDYINSKSMKTLASFFYQLECFANNGVKIKINWHYKEFDKDNFENGLFFSSLVDVPFSFIVLDN